MASIQDLLSPASKATPIGPEAKKHDDSVEKTETAWFTIEFILDLICPYCYIGLRNLDIAIQTYKARHSEAVFEVTCSPFILNPLAARSAYDKANYLQHARVHSASQLAGLGRTVGIDFAGRGLTGNTRDAHKLLRFALESSPSTARSTTFARWRRRGPPADADAAAAVPTSAESPHAVGASSCSPGGDNLISTPAVVDGSGGDNNNNSSSSIVGSSQQQMQHRRGPDLQMRLARTLFRAHHELSDDISDREFLVSAAAGATGFAASEIRAVLSGGDDDDGDDGNDGGWGRAIDDLCAEVRGRRSGSGVPAVLAVPTLVVNDRYVIGGWQRAEWLVREFERIWAAGGEDRGGKGG
ncbi:hypothetical protein AAE478_007587 [Parahypoxylon ruwenzoriense]